MSQAAPVLRDLKGVGPRLEQSLEKLGIHRVEDLLFHLPLRYEDRTRLVPIGSLEPGQHALIEGDVEHGAIVPGRRRMLVAVVSDGTGRISLRFFHFRYQQAQQFKKGLKLRCFGEVRAGYQGLEMIHPSYQRLSESTSPPVNDRLSPVYPTTEGFQQASWLRLTSQALQLLEEGRLELEELLPENLLKELKLPGLSTALHFIHRPPPEADVASLEQRRHPAQQRLALEELLAHNLSMQRLHLRQKQKKAPELVIGGELENLFREALPFTLTAAQERVTAEINADLITKIPMQRLLQGDVGSGKTVVAALAALRAASNGYQTAIMAPTELLAEQHLKNFCDWFKPLGIEPVWLSGKVLGKKRELALDAIAGGQPVAIGTHALMQEAVVFHKLGLVIVDEQHRFGVHQRLALRDKGKGAGQQPHQLIMTATPIPRTLAMTSYAGLDTSIIDELPPGRKPVTTVVASSERREEVIARVDAACREGRQAYWVCTLIDESDKLEAQAAEATATALAETLPGLKVGLVHGRLKAAKKQDVMLRFKEREINLLVATTVIEVGMDVPNASLMIIENAERLGLAQLHQLRGRVGRGSKQSSCVLLYQYPLSGLARQRLRIMRETNDGFRIAEKDLQLRGPGEVLGTRQTGMLQFRVADLGRDQDLLERIPPIASRMLDTEAARVDKLVLRWIGDARQYGEV